MQLELNEIQSLLQSGVREWLEKSLPFARVRELERSQQSDAVLWSGLHAQGWLGVAVPESLGGAGLGLVEAGLLVEELQRRAAIVPAAESLACLFAIERHGEPARARDCIARMLAGDGCCVPSVLEADDRFGSLRAEVGADGRLRGEKLFVDHAAFASHHLVAARFGGEAGLHLVDVTDPGVHMEPTRSIGRTPQARVRYEGAASLRVCGAEGLAALVRTARALCTVQAVACMQKALELTVQYTAVREQFGRPIGSFQAVQHHAADMAIDVESTRFLAFEALAALAAGRAGDEQVAIAKAAASRAVPEVTMLAHQLHGGQGFIEENDLYFFTLRGKDRSLAWGSAEECLDLVADTIERSEEWLWG